MCGADAALFKDVSALLRSGDEPEVEPSGPTRSYGSLVERRGHKAEDKSKTVEARQPLQSTCSSWASAHGGDTQKDVHMQVTSSVPVGQARQHGIAHRGGLDAPETSKTVEMRKRDRIKNSSWMSAHFGGTQKDPLCSSRDSAHVGDAQHDPMISSFASAHFGTSPVPLRQANHQVRVETHEPRQRACSSWASVEQEGLDMHAASSVPSGPASHRALAERPGTKAQDFPEVLEVYQAQRSACSSWISVHPEVGQEDLSTYAGGPEDQVVPEILEVRERKRSHCSSWASVDAPSAPSGQDSHRANAGRHKSETQELYAAQEPLDPWPSAEGMSVEERLKAALDLQFSGVHAAAKLEQVLRTDTSPEVRNVAALTLGDLAHHPSSAHRCSLALSAALGSDPDASVRCTVAGALGYSIQECVDVSGAALLLAFHEDVDTDVRRIAGTSLSMLDELMPSPAFLAGHNVAAQGTNLLSLDKAPIVASFAYDTID